jgi:hypothetical protein
VTLFPCVFVWRCAVDRSCRCIASLPSRARYPARLSSCNVHPCSRPLNLARTLQKSSSRVGHGGGLETNASAKMHSAHGSTGAPLHELAQEKWFIGFTDFVTLCVTEHGRQMLGRWERAWDAWQVRVTDVCCARIGVCECDFVTSLLCVFSTDCCARCAQGKAAAVAPEAGHVAAATAVPNCSAVGAAAHVRRRPCTRRATAQREWGVCLPRA